jgi:hypothetical protein
MRRTTAVALPGLLRRYRGRWATAGGCFGLVLAAARCSSPSAGDVCNPDENGTAGGTSVFELTVSDSAFTLGSGDSGPGEPNITVENLANVQLTMTNVGTKPHDFVIRCLPTPNTMGCSAESCFPPGARIPPLKPGAHATINFVTPIHEGAYPFVSDVPGDTNTSADGGVTGLVGQFVLM